MSQQPKNPARTRSNGTQGPLCPGGRHGYVKANRAEVVATNTASRSKRTAAEQYALLDRRLGKGVGAKRERARLIEIMRADRSQGWVVTAGASL